MDVGSAVSGCGEGEGSRNFWKTEDEEARCVNMCLCVCVCAKSSGGCSEHRRTEAVSEKRLKNPARDGGRSADIPFCVCHFATRYRAPARFFRTFLRGRSHPPAPPWQRTWGGPGVRCDGMAQVGVCSPHLSSIVFTVPPPFPRNFPGRGLAI